MHRTLEDQILCVQISEQADGSDRGAPEASFRGPQKTVDKKKKWASSNGFFTLDFNQCDIMPKYAHVFPQMPRSKTREDN